MVSRLGQKVQAAFRSAPAAIGVRVAPGGRIKLRPETFEEGLLLTAVMAALIGIAAWIAGGPFPFNVIFGVVSVALLYAGIKALYFFHYVLDRIYKLPRSTSIAIFGVLCVLSFAWAAFLSDSGIPILPSAMRVFGWIMMMMGVIVTADTEVEFDAEKNKLLRACAYRENELGPRRSLIVANEYVHIGLGIAAVWLWFKYVQSDGQTAIGVGAFTYMAVHINALSWALKEWRAAAANRQQAQGTDASSIPASSHSISEDRKGEPNSGAPSLGPSLGETKQALNEHLRKLGR
jgi:hypothetical protein